MINFLIQIAMIKGDSIEASEMNDCIKYCKNNIRLLQFKSNFLKKTISTWEKYKFKQIQNYFSKNLKNTINKNINLASNNDINELKNCLKIYLILGDIITIKILIKIKLTNFIMIWLTNPSMKNLMIKNL